ncbi:SIP domain-containing protein [uncultured Roseobacter sp.]|uniref:SIP domain-containing protein n=1 Tax=uncultured Roseobacter sp. TaxID=114847 RepID=UPI0026229395|nr:SIP domain-containing protein [uncultured Roseobacter sp.]
MAFTYSGRSLVPLFIALIAVLSVSTQDIAVDTHAQNVILAGDANGLPQIAHVTKSVVGEITGHVFAAAPSQAALEAHLPKSKMRVCALNPDAFSKEMAERLEQCPSEPFSYGSLVGEFEAAQSVETVFKQTFGLDKHTQLSIAYWRAGAPGHHSRAF